MDVPAERHRKSLRIRTGILRLLPNCAQPVYCQDQAPIGYQFWLERRYFEHSVIDKSRLKDWRRQEIARNVNTRMLQDFGLNDNEWLPAQKYGARPNLVSCRYLLCWFSTRWCMAIAKHGARPSSAQSWARCVADFFNGAREACATLDDRPSIGVDDARMTLDGEARLDLNGLVAGPWPALVDEWDAIAAMPNPVIPAMPASLLVSLEHWHWFIFLRCHYAEEAMERDCLVMQLRGVTVDVCAWLSEVHVHLAVQEALQRHDDPVPTALVGPKGRKVRGCCWRRYRVLRRMVHGFGSDQVAAVSLGFRRGDAAVMQSIRARLYGALTRRELAGCTGGFALCWDGSSHGGLDTLVGTVTACATSRSFYLRPQAAPPTYTYICVSYSPMMTDRQKRCSRFISLGEQPHNI